MTVGVILHRSGKTPACATRIERRVRNRVVKRITETDAIISNAANTAAELKCVVLFYPRHVVGDSLHGSYSCNRTAKCKWRKHKPETYLVCGRVTLLREGLTSITIGESVDEPIAYCPRMAHSNTGWMRPNIRWRRIRKLRSLSRQVINDIRADKQLLTTVKVEIEPAYV